MRKSKSLVIYQFKNWLFRHHMKKIAKVFDLITRILFACDIPASVQLRGGVLAHMGLGIVIHPRAVIGQGFKLFQNVTIGSRNGSNPPRIGENFYAGAGATIIGDITIGNNVTVGAGAVVLKDVPDNCMAIGVPAKIYPKKQNNG